MPTDDLIERLRERAIRHYKVPIMASHSLEAEAADEIERLRAKCQEHRENAAALLADHRRLWLALADMAQDWCCLHHPDDTHVEVLMPVDLFKEFRDE